MLGFGDQPVAIDRYEAFGDQLQEQGDGEAALRQTSAGPAGGRVASDQVVQVG
jgi:hypothetical protein